MSEDVRDNYNKMSRFYDTFAKPEKKYIYQCLDMLPIKNGSKFLEIGFGTGDAILKLSKFVGNPANIFGIDISEGMLEVAQSKLKNEGIIGVNLLLGDARKLPFDDNYFDYVFMSFTLELFDYSDIQVVLKEIYRVLDKNGIIGLVALSERDNDNYMTKLYKWAHMKFPAYVDCRPIRTENELISAGFKIEKLKKEEMWDLPIDIVISTKTS
jgi:demethylmenaquinone methyltransferase/2-methoxy-6-polyprenyl-1,4-benzoquinol methylase